MTARTAALRGQEDLAELVDVEALSRWMDEREVDAGAPLKVVEILHGGTQNILLRLRRGERDLVLRRGPQHLRPKTNDNLRREMRVVAALGRTAFPHARLVAACPEENVLDGAAFYLMELVDGFSSTVEMPWPPWETGRTRRLCLSAVEALASLADVDYVAVGLSDVGRPDGFLERQVDRWQAELASYSVHEGYDGPRLPGVEVVADWLNRNRPGASSPGILHGDFHLANLLVDRGTGEIVAVVDWEMATIGDPLLDLGSLLATWPRAGRPNGLWPGASWITAAVEPDALVRHYEERSQRDLSAVDWYHVLACFKLGILLEGTYARACAGLAPRATGERLHIWAVNLLDQGRAIAGV